jgi:hypothetical protein
MTVKATKYLRLLSSFLLVSLASNVWAEPASSSDEERMKFFENHVRPLLVERCFECHSGENIEGGLRLDASSLTIDGGDSGPAVVAGSPDESLLVSAIRYEELEMPPDEPLSAKQQEVIERWVRDGAYWPQSIGDRTDQPVADYSQWWASQPLQPGVIPARSEATHSHRAIDRYIDRALDAAGLERAPKTDRTRLIRRLSFDLTGLPPTPEEIERFVNDDRPGAYRRLVQRMLADPAYGERMARLWLDLVRYAESDGWRADAFRPQAWRYRQFVTDAFNSGMPYDRFVALQIAGDEIAPGDEEALAAVGFLRLGIYEYNQRDAEGQWQNIVDEITDVTADVFLATGIACAKCHDHKFDPIPRSDYYRVRSVFEPLTFVDWERQSDRTPEQQQEVDKLLSELREVEGDDVKNLGEAVVEKFPLHIQAMYRKPAEERTAYEEQMAYLVARQYYEEGLAGNKADKKLGKERAERRAEILQQLDRLGANPYQPADLMTIADANGAVRPTRLPGRSSGRSFEPGIPQVFGGDELLCQPPQESPRSTGRRSALAKWITSQNNAIAARVMVNRLWQYHFGTGLVESPNDFGQLGSPPSHPELLDYLAVRFVESGWDIQAVQREIVLSETYQQSSVHPDADRAMQVDADNRLLWHKSVRRLDAEQYRDALLVVMGSMHHQVGGPSVSGTPPRRSLYLRRMRNSGDEMLTALDAPPGLVGTAKRDVTTTAPQSLMMMNSPRIMGVANKFAERIRRDLSKVSSDRFDEEFVRRGHLLIAGVPADDATVALLAPMVASGSSGQVDVCHILINSNAFLFID